jgi:hypothetical protein
MNHHTQIETKCFHHTPQVTSVSGSALSSPWSTPTKTSPRGVGRGGCGGLKDTAVGVQLPLLPPPAAIGSRDSKSQDEQLYRHEQHHQQYQQPSDRELEQPQLGKSLQQNTLESMQQQQQQQPQQPQQQQQQQQQQQHQQQQQRQEQQHHHHHHHHHQQQQQHELEAKVEEERNAQHAQLQEQLRSAEETIVLLNVRTQRLEGKSPPTHFCGREHLLPLPYLHVVFRSSGHV